MIGIFFIVNVFLFVSYITAMKTGTAISEDAINNTALILAQNNVIIDKSIIPKKPHDLRIFDFVNKYESPDAAANHFWDVAHKEGLDYFNPENVTTGSDFFEYKSNVLPTDNTFNESTALSYAKRTVSLLGLDSFMTLESSLKKTDYGYSVSFNQVYEGTAVLDSCLTVELSGGSITRIFGENWLGDTITGGGMSSIRAATEILVNFAVENEHTDKVIINDVKLGYFIGGRNGIKSTVTVVPVWMLSTNTKGILYYDARNGDLLK
mgnify:CR=1 FL=1